MPEKTPKPSDLLPKPTYETPIPPERKAAYDAWRKTQSDSGVDYDLPGFFLSGAAKDKRGHGTDRFKKPNHPTFSNESQYSGLPGGPVGGRWARENGQDVFYASPANLQYRSPQELQQYFAEFEPGVKLVLPPVEQFPLVGVPRLTDLVK